MLWLDLWRMGRQIGEMTKISLKQYTIDLEARLELQGRTDEAGRLLPDAIKAYPRHRAFQADMKQAMPKL